MDRKEKFSAEILDQDRQAKKINRAVLLCGVE